LNYDEAQWDLRHREILRTINIPGTVGTIDVKLIPHDQKARAFTAGMRTITSTL